MENINLPCRVLVQEYLSLTRRVSDLISEDSKDIRETAENLICKGM